MVEQLQRSSRGSVGDGLNQNTLYMRIKFRRNIWQYIFKRINFLKCFSMPNTGLNDGISIHVYHCTFSYSLLLISDTTSNGHYVPPKSSSCAFMSCHVSACNRKHVIIDFLPPPLPPLPSLDPSPSPSLYNPTFCHSVPYLHI